MTIITYQIMDSILSQLKMRCPEVAVEYFPDEPERYRLNHGQGALLLNYARGDYGNHEDTDAVATDKAVRFTLTVVSRELHGQGELARHESALGLLWRAGLALQGFYAAQTTQKIKLEREYFIDRKQGLYYYGLDFSTTTMQVQDCF